MQFVMHVSTNFRVVQSSYTSIPVYYTESITEWWNGKFGLHEDEAILLQERVLIPGTEYDAIHGRTS